MNGDYHYKDEIAFPTFSIITLLSSTTSKFWHLCIWNNDGRKPTRQKKRPLTFKTCISPLSISAFTKLQKSLWQTLHRQSLTAKKVISYASQFKISSKFIKVIIKWNHQQIFVKRLQTIFHLTLFNKRWFVLFSKKNSRSNINPHKILFHV